MQCNCKRLVSPLRGGLAWGGSEPPLCNPGVPRGMLRERHHFSGLSQFNWPQVDPVARGQELFKQFVQPQRAPLRPFKFASVPSFTSPSRDLCA
eukprot:361612-Chlamydomonas_euryale.AAC.30